jgi:hypothetical protein
VFSHCAEDGSQFISVPCLALGDHPELASDQEAIKSLVDKLFRNLEVHVIRRIAEYLSESRFSEIVEAIALDNS